MNRLEWITPVPHSVGLNRPQRPLPPGACDSHMHIFDPRFAPSAHWPRTPPVAPVVAYRQLQSRLGTTRTVVVTPSTYGTDNACTLDALDQLGNDARGVAVVGEEVSSDELAHLAARRVRGLRVNFVSPQSWGTTTPDMLATLARKVGEHPACAGWHIQIFAHPEQLIALAPQLHTLPVPLIIDHLGRIDPAEGSTAEAYGVVRGLLDGGNTWVKLSGAYMRSTVHGPSYADTLPLGQALVQAAPERLVWGSDWPHTTEAPGTVNDAELVDLLQAWAGSDAAMDRILVDNPARLYGFDTAAPA
ncbi:putative TIM-barrel fold metal-dependent hydrolase [Acidovorax delafieldii]|uniref:TIM-barrel fold metal-dependent hydrolase n=1 Tax=Acidovorax delafieldii TaxID=47920 RepID=A0AAJ2F4P2_ACIDE|nr:amidohydrolase family protein [Acidovorax delafieldii]MDR6767283.1 putative TIM-barrel fold metal-dependent hydrolase [Acidovorax delafieldii]MDR6838000.1 putative TIM-barrel fold metal-dependent hydrolase [Acidovorax delafieldii]MDR7367996.1 putative TIM-barrel fold metal-dependent hydrolase [Acidovorax delafieldii]